MSSVSSTSQALMQFSGAGSGLPISQIIDALMSVERQPVDRLYSEQSTLQTQKTTFTTMGSKLSSLRSSVEKFTDGNLATVFDVFSKRTTSTTDNAIANITANNGAAIQNITLKVNNLATATTAQSVNNPGEVISGDELVSALGNGSAVVTVTDEDTKEEVGTTFSLYLDNKKYTINLDKTTTLNKSCDSKSIISQINSVTGGKITASIVDGKFQIAVTDGDTHHDLKLGSSSDTSNFLNVMQLNTKTYVKDSDGNPTTQVDKITSDNQISSIYTAGTIVGENATSNLSTVVTKGDFTIGKATFTIDENTTLANLIASINSNEDANVVAVFDARSNKLKLTSKDPGATYINLSNDNVEGNSTNKSNFLTAMGLTVSNPGGTDDNTIISGSQTLGKNASIVLNGNTLEANTNTVGSDITGMYGVTIKLNGTTPTNTGGSTTVTLGVKQDTSAITSTVNDFLTKFNAFTSEVDTDTNSTGGTLKSEYTLVRLKNDLRSALMDSVDGLTTYNSMGIIGVSSGAVGTSVDTKTNTLSLDTSKLEEALTKNPQEVKDLFIGDKARGITGIFQILKSKLDTALDPVNGYINTKQDSIDSQLTSLAKSISDGELRLQDKKDTLTKQYAQMDQLVSQLKSQSTAFGIY